MMHMPGQSPTTFSVILLQAAAISKH